MLSESNFYSRSVLSNSVRRQALWNVLEPGDPYDIKKSMIAKLPGDNKIFMGQHLDMVCLFQAAQIERLCEFLEDYRLKFRQIERSNLDRHSYEVQIKQLTQLVSQYESYKGQNVKLVDYARNQSNVIEEFKRNARDAKFIDENFRGWQQKANQKINQLSNQNKSLKDANEEYKKQVQNFNARFEALQRAKNKQLEDLKLNFSIHEKDNMQNTLNFYKIQSQGQVKRLEFELKRMRQSNDLKSQEFLNLQRKNEQYTRQLILMKGKLQAVAILQQKYSQIQRKLAYSTAQMERFKINLRQCQSKYEQSELKRRQVERKAQKYDYEIREYDAKLRQSNSEAKRLADLVSRLEGDARKVGQSQKSILNYQAQLRDLSRQNENLQGKIVQQLNKSQKMVDELNKLSYENSKYRLIQKQNNEMKEGLIQRDSLKRRVVELQNKIAFLSQQMQRSYITMKNKDIQLQRLKGVANQNQILKKKLKQLEINLTNRYESQIVRTRTEYEQKIEYISRTKGNQFQIKAQNYEKETERLAALLKSKIEENQKNKSKINELQSYINRSQLENSANLKNLQNNYGMVRRQNEELYLKARKLQQIERKLYDIQAKNSQLQKENERLTIFVKKSEEQLFGLKNKLRQTEGFSQRNEIDLGRKIVIYQQNLHTMRVQNDQLRVKLNEYISQATKKNNQLMQELQKGNSIIRHLSEQKNQLEYKLKQLNQQLDFLKQNLQKLNKENDELKAKFLETDTKLNNTISQTNFNTKNLSAENENLKKQLNDYKVSISNFQIQVNKRVISYEQNIKILTNQDEQLRRRYRQLQVNYSNIKQENEVNLKKLRIKTQQYTLLETNLKSAIQQIDNIRRKYQQYELSINSKINNYQKTIQSLRQDQQLSKRRIQQLQSKNSQLIQQLERANINFKNIQIENQNQRKIIAQKDNNALNIDADIKNRTLSYESNIQGLIQANEELRNNLNNMTIKFNKKTQQFIQGEERYRQLAGQYEGLQLSYNNLELSFKNKMEGEVLKRYNLYQETITKQKQQAERMILSLNQLIADNQILKKKKQAIQVSIATYEGEVNRRITQNEQAIANLTREREELISKIHQFSNVERKLLESQVKVKNLEAQIERMSALFKQNTEKLNQQLLRRIQESNQIMRRFAELEGKYSYAVNDGQRLNSLLKNKQEELSRMQLKNRNQTQEIDVLRLQTSELQKKFANTFEFEVAKRYNTYELTISELKKKIAQLQNKSYIQTQQFERVNSMLKSKGQQSSQLSTTYRTTTIQLQNLRKRVQQSELSLTQTLNSSRRQSQDLKRIIREYQLRIKQLQSVSGKNNGESQSRLINLNTQIQRLNKIIVGLSNENALAQKQFQQYESSINQKFDIEVRNMNHQVTQLNKENENLRKKILEYSDIHRQIAQIENRSMILAQENERLNSLIKLKNEEFNKLLVSYTDIKKRMQSTSTNRSTSIDSSIKIAQYEQKLAYMIQQNQRLQLALKNKTDPTINFDYRIKDLTQQNQVLKKELSELEYRFNQNRENYYGIQQDISILAKQRDDLRRYRHETESRVAFLTQQIERLNSLFSQTNERNTIALDYENAQKHLAEYEENIKKLYAEFERLQIIIKDLKVQNKVTIQKNRNLSEQITRLREQNIDLENQAKDVRLRFTDESALQKRLNQHMALMVVLFAEIESLRKRVEQKQIQVEDIRRRSISPNIIR